MHLLSFVSGVGFATVVMLAVSVWFASRKGSADSVFDSVRRENIAARAQELIDDAVEADITVTIHTEPGTPLAMGNHQMVLSVRDRDYRLPAP